MILEQGNHRRGKRPMKRKEEEDSEQGMGEVEGKMWGGEGEVGVGKEGWMWGVGGLVCKEVGR